MFAFLSCASSISAQAQAIADTQPTARDIYVGCSLFVNDADVPKDENGHFRAFSGERCALYSLLAIRDRESKVVGKDNRLRFCLPHTAEVSQNPARAMAYTYIEFFETRSATLADKPGNTAYVLAMISKWPC